MWFTDEKVFTVATPNNPQNDRLYAPIGVRKGDINAKRLLRTRTTFSQSVMVSVGVSKLGSTHLIFVHPGVKINGDYYRDVLLMQEMLPVIREISGEFFILQQDGAPAHRARDTVKLLERETPAFISSRNVAAEFTRSKPGRLSDLRGNAAACVSKENKHRGRVEAASG